MIAISFNNRKKVVSDESFKSDLPNLIDGVDILDALCPVSKKTGLRENPLTLLRKVVSDPVKARLLEQSLQELPVDNSQCNLSDDDKVNFLMMRLDSGSPTENEHFRQILLDSIDVLSPSQHEAVKSSDSSKISFEGNENVSTEVV